MTLRTSIPNIITLSRIAFTAMFVVLSYTVFYCSVINNQYYVSNAYLIFCFSAIILSDIIDGRVARKMNLSSVQGAKLDLTADLVYVMGTVGIFVYFNKLPAWFLFALLFSYIEFFITSKLLIRHDGSGSHVVFDKLGKTAAILTMLLPGVFVFRCMPLDYTLLMRICAFAITALFFVSSVYRISLVVKSLKKK